ncbi:MAG: RNA polymerase sigma factor [Gammaproteobacteria bacterium]
MSPEVALIKRAQAGEEEAFRLIVERYQAKVFSIIHGILRNRNDAEDIAQQVFTKIYFSLRKFNFRSALVTWIYKITVNECYDYLRKQKVRKLTYESDLNEDDLRRVDNMEDTRRNPAEAIDRRTELREYVVRLLDKLSEEERHLLIMKEVEGYPVEELARMVSMNENTVKVKLFRARQKLVKAAKKAGLGMSAVATGAR